MKNSRKVIGLMAVLALGACGSAGENAGTRSSIDYVDVTVIERIQPASVGGSFDQRYKSFRVQQGLPRVQADSRLTRAARRHASDMARRGFFGHRGSDGTKPSDRVKSAGFRPCYTAENIGQGPFNEAQIFDAWVRSYGHRANMVRRGNTRYGVAEVGGYWVMVMAEPC